MRPPADAPWPDIRLPDAWPPADLRAAFLGTDYGTAQDRFRLVRRRGPVPPRLPAWAGGAWGIVTAHNPGGQQAAAGANAQANAQLQRRIQAAGWPTVAGHNGSGEWREATFIVPGAGLRQLAAWGREFGQAAVLWGQGQRAALVWLPMPHPREQPRHMPPQPEPCLVERYWLIRNPYELEVKP